MLFAIDLCEKCIWIGIDPKIENRKNTEATRFCPRCGSEVVCVPLRLTLKEIVRRWVA